MISGARAFIAALWLGGCTIPLEIGSNQPLPNWSGVPQDADGDGVGVAIDCDDTDPGVGGKPEICDGLDNDCDDVVDEDGVCAVTELFELHGNLDLLVVVDASDEAARVRERFLDVLPGILQPLFREEVTAQVAVAGANGKSDAIPWASPGGEPFLRSWTTNLADATAWITDAIDTLPGDAEPRPLDVALGAVQAAVASHESFDRPGTKLAILFVTPESDGSATSAAQFVSELDVSQNALWTAWAVLPPAEGTCEPKLEEGESASVLTPLRELVLTELGGENLFDACQDRLDDLRVRLADDGDLIEGTSRTVYPLGHAFQDGTMRVFRMAGGVEERLDGYIASGRTLTFPDPLPAEGVLRVEYDLAP